MDKISETREFLRFIKQVLNRQLTNNVVYSYVFISNKTFKFDYDITELEQEIELCSMPDRLKKVFDLCIENLELFKQLQEIGNSEAKHEVCYYTYNDNRFAFTNNRKGKELKEFSNVSYHSNTTLWDFCYNVMKLTENKEVNQPKIESQTKESPDKWTMPVFALYLYYLEQGFIEKIITKKYLPELMKKYSYTQKIDPLNNEIIRIKKGNSIKNKTNLEKVITLLRDFQNCQELAINDLKEHNYN